MSHLFEPFTLRSITLRNRIGISPMCQYSAEDGLPNDWHLVHLGARATGGAGLVIVEATAVEARGRITLGDLGLWSDGQVDHHARLAYFIKARGAVPGIQIAHAGRKASAAVPWEGGHHLELGAGGWEIVGPSAIPFGKALHRGPVEMTENEIQIAQNAFVAAAQRALAAGYEWLELHGAHGYLAHSFYSPLSNHRTDRYGGTFANRVRFLIETARAVRRVWPEHLPLATRLSASDWVPGGWSIEDSIALARQLRAEGVDLIDCSSGGAVHDAKIPSAPGYQVPFAEAIKRNANIATAAVGLISEPAQADEIIRSGRADLVLLAREALRDPHWPLRAAQALGQPWDHLLPVQYARAAR